LAAAAPHLDAKEPTMQEQFRAVSLEAMRNGEMVEVALRGQARQPIEAHYVLEFRGDSRTRHAGGARLSPGETVELSRLRVKTGAKWCATASVEQSDGLKYTLRDGDCG